MIMEEYKNKFKPVRLRFSLRKRLLDKLVHFIRGFSMLLLTVAGWGLLLLIVIDNLTSI